MAAPEPPERTERPEPPQRRGPGDPPPRPRPGQPPQHRRPDLRPMLILVGLLVLVTLGWLLLVPAILPAP